MGWEISFDCVNAQPAFCLRLSHIKSKIQLMQQGEKFASLNFLLPDLWQSPTLRVWAELSVVHETFLSHLTEFK